MNLRKIFLCTQGHYGSKPASVRWTTIDDRGWVEGETPVEDFGMYLILDEEISSESAERIFTALICDREGEAPEVKEEITREDKLFRSVHLPPLLTPNEHRIFSYLTKKELDESAKPV